MGSRAKRYPLAAAIGYREGDLAPRLLAKGQGEMAEVIIDKARELGIPLREDQALILPLLLQLDIYEYIPPELYTAIVEILVWVHQLEERKHPTQPSVTTEDL